LGARTKSLINNPISAKTSGFQKHFNSSKTNNVWLVQDPTFNTQTTLHKTSLEALLKA
jgi:hypothetical protein